MSFHLLRLLTFLWCTESSVKLRGFLFCSIKKKKMFSKEKLISSLPHIRNFLKELYFLHFLLLFFNSFQAIWPIESNWMQTCLLWLMISLGLLPLYITQCKVTICGFKCLYLDLICASIRNKIERGSRKHCWRMPLTSRYFCLFLWLCCAGLSVGHFFFYISD